IDLSRALRAEARVRSATRPVDRAAAEEAYRRLGGGDLPDEATLRGYLTEGIRLGGPPLSLGVGDRPGYRILLSGDLEPTGLIARWGMAPGDRPGVVGTMRRDQSTVDLRRIGAGTAWAVDVTGSPAPLRALVTECREHGLIPLTVERFS